MTELDVQLSRTVAELVAARHGRWVDRATSGTRAGAMALLTASLVSLLLR